MGISSFPLPVGDDKNPGENFAWGVKMSTFNFWLGNAFCCILYTRNLKISSNMVDYTSLRENWIKVLERDKALRRLIKTWRDVSLKVNPEVPGGNWQNICLTFFILTWGLVKIFLILWKRGWWKKFHAELYIAIAFFGEKRISFKSSLDLYLFALIIGFF